MLSINDQFPIHSISGIFNRKISEYNFGKHAVILVYWGSDYRDLSFIEWLSKNIHHNSYNHASFFGASVDSLETHQKLLQEITLDFPVLSDLSHMLALKLGILDKLGYSKNSCFLTDKDGKVKLSFAATDQTMMTSLLKLLS
jgi:peroxiredoxin